MWKFSPGYQVASGAFSGIEGQVRQRLTRNLGVTAFGDTVRARLAGASVLPHIPDTRVGVQLDVNWSTWPMATSRSTARR